MIRWFCRLLEELEWFAKQGADASGERKTFRAKNHLIFWFWPWGFVEDSGLNTVGPNRFSTDLINLNSGLLINHKSGEMASMR